MRKLFLFTAMLLAALMACRQATETENTAGKDSVATDSATASCTDPNGMEVKPMALGMRAMYEQMRIVRARIEENKKLQPGEFKSIDFIYAEPTDTTVLTDEFYMRAGMFKRTFNEMMDPADSRPIEDRYNLVLDACVQCHMENCPGPVKKIKKLRFEKVRV